MVYVVQSLLIDKQLYVCDVGTKNVAKEFEITTQGPVRDKNVTWFLNWLRVGDVDKDDDDYDDNAD